MFAKRIERITLKPRGEHYVASGSWNFVGPGSIGGAGGAAQTDRYFPFTLKVAA